MRDKSSSSKKRNSKHVTTVDKDPKSAKLATIDESTLVDEISCNKTKQLKADCNRKQTSVNEKKPNNDEFVDKYEYMDQTNNSSPQKKEPTFTQKKEPTFTIGQLENAKSDETKKNMNDSKTLSTISMKSEFKPIHHPICPQCHDKFDVYNSSDQTPVMSMSCEHTLCRNCAIISIRNNQTKLRKKTVMIASCPIKNCLSKNAFRLDKLNENMELITLCQKMYHIDHNLLK